jgi:hypothetical protein
MPLIAIEPPFAMPCTTPDSLVQICARSSTRLDISFAIARKYLARSACFMRGHGPRSNALRAAATARFTSASCASATRANSSSVPLLITSITDVLDGEAQLPSMKKRSGCLIGAAAVMGRVSSGVIDEDRVSGS